ncbi:hypothetical protein RIF29_36225 [Crotalaria pallida]|uniref:Uncharacterized protein n=1 Tax=Crotalaria pallida TaxID=3830 RepID=A0AAN9HUH1_CROPI
MREKRSLGPFPECCVLNSLVVNNTINFIDIYYLHISVLSFPLPAARDHLQPVLLWYYYTLHILSATRSQISQTVLALQLMYSFT